jgi:RimJ/RimL family protein N-acetyltransferase
MAIHQYTFTDLMELRDVYGDLNAIPFLYELLRQRDINTVSLSHRVMPTVSEHIAFVMSKPYTMWFVVWADGIRVGAIYLTNRNEIGIDIRKNAQRKGYGEWAVRKLMSTCPMHGNKPIQGFYANVNPKNTPSLNMFRKLGFVDFQMTLRYNVAQQGGCGELSLHGPGAGIQSTSGFDEVAQAPHGPGGGFPTAGA